jgi:hypothetical protein
MNDTMQTVGVVLSRAHELAAIFNAASIDEPISAAPPDPVWEWAQDVARHDAPLHLRFGTLRIRTHDDGTWEPYKDGRRAIVLNVPTPAGEPCDLIAWRHDDPQQWWRRTKIAVLLGMSDAQKYATTGDTLYVHSTPERWLFSGGHGVCVLDWSADLTFWFDGIPKIAADSEELAIRLAKHLKRRSGNATVRESKKERKYVH